MFFFLTKRSAIRIGLPSPLVRKMSALDKPPTANVFYGQPLTYIIIYQQLKPIQERQSQRINQIWTCVSPGPKLLRGYPQKTSVVRGEGVCPMRTRVGGLRMRTSAAKLRFSKFMVYPHGQGGWAVRTRG